jgi:hypothetical protein
MRDVLGSDRLREAAPRDRRAHSLIAAGRQERAEAIDRFFGEGCQRRLVRVLRSNSFAPPTRSTH